MVKIKNWDDSLPDSSSWAPTAPKDSARKIIQEGLHWTTRASALRIRAAADVERSFNIHNFDAGAAIEDVVRQELRALLPDRYQVMAGVVADAAGNSAGDCEVLVVNRFWAPLVKLPATSQSRRCHIPVEALYSAIEVKQTLTFDALDLAFQKLVTVARLERRIASSELISENMKAPSLVQSEQKEWVRNPLLKAILAVYPGESDFRDLARRFFAINKQLNINEKVNFLCVLQGGLAFYICQPKPGVINAMNYMTDRNLTRNPVVLLGDKEDGFSVFVTELYGHCTRSILDVADVHARYIPQVWRWEGIAPLEEPLPSP